MDRGVSPQGPVVVAEPVQADGPPQAAKDSKSVSTSPVPSFKAVHESAQALLQARPEESSSAFQAREVRALGSGATGAAQDVDRLAQKVLDAAAAQDPDAIAIERTVAAALDAMAVPNADRLPLYRSFLRTALLSVAAEVMKANRQMGSPMLTGLSGSLAEVMDEYVAFAMTDPLFSGKPHAQVAAQLAADLQRTFATFPRLRHGLETEKTSFARNIGDLMARLDARKEDIEAVFLKKGQKMPAVSAITITGSDPHHGGQRVMIVHLADEAGTRLVYKPRDCRVDARIVGEPGVGGVGQTVAGVVNAHLRSVGIPTCRYLLGGKDGGAYAFVSFVSHRDTPPEGQDSLKVLDAYFRHIGIAMATARFLGLTDIHQGNVIVDEQGRPVMTDLEIAFSRDVLGSRKPSQDKSSAQADGKAAEDWKAGDRRRKNALRDTGFQDMLGKVSELEPALPIRVGADGRIELVEPRRRQLTSNYLLFNGRPASLKDPEYGERFAKALRQGFEEVLEAMADPSFNQSMLALLEDEATGFAGLHVRFHAIATGEQQQRLQMYKADARKPPALLPGSVKIPDAARAVPLRQGDGEVDPLDVLMPSVLHDFSQGDIAYFSRQLGEGGNLYHHDRSGKAQIPGSDKHLGYDGLACATDLIRSSASGPATLASIRQEFDDLLALERSGILPKWPPDGLPADALGR